MVERRGDQPLCLYSTVLGGHNGPGTDDRLRHLVKEFKLAVAERVMDHATRCLRPAGRHSDQMKYRHMFSIGSANAVDRA
jgi:hypothetical protein